MLFKPDLHMPIAVICESPILQFSFVATVTAEFLFQTVFVPLDNLMQKEGHPANINFISLYMIQSICGIINYMRKQNSNVKDKIKKKILLS